MPDQRIAVTGATGTLGREVVGALERRAGTRVRSVSRRPRPADLPADGEWVSADLGRDPLGPVVAECDAIIHLASEKGTGTADVAATRGLLEAAATAAVRHVVVISIIGCDRIPLPFYASKVEIEGAVRSGSVSWSIVRVAQFHSFVERMISAAASLPVPAPIVADLRFQSVDEREAAELLVDIALGPPLGDAPEIAGPDVRTLGDLAGIWLGRKGRPGTLIPVTVADLEHGTATLPALAPWALAVLRGYAAGDNIPKGRRTLGRVSFDAWLERTDGASRSMSKPR